MVSAGRNAVLGLAKFARMLLAVAIWTACGAQIAEAGGYRLLVTDPASGEEVVNVPLNRDETFTIRYVHSVDGTPVFEIFETDSRGRLALQATYFRMFGAGMGHWEGRGKVDFDGRWTWIRDIHETLGEFILRVGSPRVDHTILYRNREIHLSDEWARRPLHVTVVEAIQEKSGETGEG